jgi:hypothetical protein
MLQHHDISRYDRIMFKSRNNSWTPLCIAEIGVEPIAIDNTTNRPIVPSDHFGLQATVVRK